MLVQCSSFNVVRTWAGNSRQGSGPDLPGDPHVACNHIEFAAGRRGVIAAREPAEATDESEMMTTMTQHEPQLRQLVERGQEEGRLMAAEIEALIAELELSDEDRAALNEELEELGVEVVAVQEADASQREEQAAPTWYAPQSISSLDLYLAE